MKKRLKKVLAVVFTMSFIVSTNVYAGVVNKTLTLPENTWVETSAEARVSNLDYALARCISVYPTDGRADNYHRIKCRLKKGNTVISKSIVGYVLHEQNGYNTKIEYNGDYPKGTKVKVCFMGNDPALKAKADVLYTVN